MRASTIHRLELIAAAVLFSTGGAAIKATALTSWQIAGLRSGIAAVFILLVVPGARRGWSWRTIVIGAGYAGTVVCFVVANKLTTAANAIFIQAAAPLYILLLGPWLLREPIHRRDLGFMAVVVTGLALFFVGEPRVSDTAPDPLRGNIFAMLSGIFWALTVVGLRWSGSRAEAGQAAYGVVVAGSVIAFLVTLPAALPIHDVGVVDVGMLLYLGVLQNGLAYVLVTHALRHVRALEASLVLLVEPALNPIWAFLLLAERPSAWAFLGGAIIIVATIAKAWRDGRGVRPVRAVERPGAG